MQAAIRDSRGLYDPTQLFDPLWWVQAVEVELEPVLREVMTEAAISTALEHDMVPVLKSAGWAQLAGASLLAQVEGLYGYAETIGRRVVELAERGNEEDWSKAKLSDMLGLVAAAGQMSDAIAENMGETEGQFAAQAGQMDVVMASGRAAVKTWEASFVNTRETHAAAHGQTVQVEENFLVGTGAGQWPCDWSFPAGERINCACNAIVTVLEPSPEAASAVSDPIEFRAIRPTKGDDLRPGMDSVIDGIRKKAPDGRRAITKAVREGKPTEPLLMEKKGGKGTKLNKALTRVREAINGTHSSPAGMQKIPVAENATRGKGAFRSGRLRKDAWEDPGTAYDITLSTKGATPNMTMAHEYGHYFDFDDINGIAGRWTTVGTDIDGLPNRAWMNDLTQSDNPRRLSGKIHGEFFDRAVDPLTEWRIAVRQSQSYDELIGLFDSKVDDVVVAFSDGTLGRVPVGSIGKTHARYLLDEKELFARSYAQWIAEESGDKIMLGELDILRGAAQTEIGTLKAGVSFNPTATQWSEADFAPIREAFRKIFGDAGLLEVVP